MYTVTVLFDIQATHFEAFKEAIVENARTSLRVEPGCKQFDVCTGPDGENQVFLYELYLTKDDFLAHLQSPHFLAFDAMVRDWVAKKAVTIYTRLLS